MKVVVEVVGKVVVELVVLVAEVMEVVIVEVLLLDQPVSDLMMTMVGTAPSHCWWKAPAWKLWSLALNIVVQAWLGLPTQLLRSPDIS